MVNHEKLLLKLHDYGIRGNTLSWIRAFLRNRSQRVMLSGESSDAVPVTSGVPQGSVLGLILFLVYINDLPEGITSQVRLFADDTAVYLTVDSDKDERSLQTDLDSLQTWSKKWDMSFNPSKCQVLQITKAKCPIPTRYTLHGQTLITVPSARYLGVDIANNLSWNTHVDRVTASANKTLGFLRRNVRTSAPGVRELAYKALVRPQLEYASCIWDPHTKANISKVEMVQRRAARWTLNNYSRYSSVTSMFNQLGWRSLEQRRADARLCLLFKIIHGLVTLYIITPTNHDILIHRLLGKCTLEQITTNIPFFSLTIIQWNALPEEAVLSRDLHECL
jgi:hypothetical protein